MKKSPSANLPEAIDFDVFLHLLNATPEHTPTQQVKQSVKNKLMQRIAQSDKQFFVFAEQGDWKAIKPGIEIKVLNKAADSKSFLLKLGRDTTLPYHDHMHNEETFVLDGEVWLDGVHCAHGDYHFAGAGTFHKEIRTETGCTLLVKTY